MEFVQAGALRAAYETAGEPDGWPVILLHGFPYDVRAYAEVAPLLALAGARVIVPWLRGYGATTFRDAAALRSGQQAALGHDLRDLIEALGLERPLVGGYDWGGRAACVVAALWPEAISGLVTVDGYNIQNIAAGLEPLDPETEHALWYQFYLHGDRGRAGLAQNRSDFARLLWRLWSPGWDFTDADFSATAGSFDNPDFVDVVVHSYRHRFGLVAGDPAYDVSERLLAAQPTIGVPTVVIDAAVDGLGPPSGLEEYRRHFRDMVDHRLITCGHNVPQEAPAEFAAAFVRLHDSRSPS